MSFSCSRCGYVTKHKHCLEKHLQRATPCEPTISHASPSQLLEELRRPSMDKLYKQMALGNIMAFFSCERCGFVALRKFSIERHLQKKTPCEARLSSRDRASILAELRDWKCDVCDGVQFACPYRYAAHMKLHNIRVDMLLHAL